jgi:hypothetical protein
MKAAGSVGTLELVDRELKPDTKKRLSLGKALAGLDPAARGKTKPLGSFAKHAKGE